MRIHLAREWRPHPRRSFRPRASLRKNSRYIARHEDEQNIEMVAPGTQNGGPVPISGEEPRVILDGCYHRYPNTTNLRYQLKLYENQFVFQAKGKTTAVSMEDVIGCHVMRLNRASTSPTSGGDSAFFCIYAYHLASRKGLKGSSGLARQRHMYVFEIDICASYENNLRVARKWQSAFLWILRGHQFEVDEETGDTIIPESLPAQRRYLCLVNPKSGPGRSLEIFLERVRPVFSEADVSYLLLVTERCNHAREFVRNLELDQWSGVIIVSGDGLLHEVYNGLMERPDADQAIKIPVGIIPGGSGNGLARSICHASGEPYLADPILACTLGCVKGRVIPLDLCKIEMPKKEPIYSFLSYGWGMMSDIDIESEKLRSIGEIRFTLWAFWRIFNLRTYSGRISYLPATEHLPSRAAVLKKSSVPNGEVQSPVQTSVQPAFVERTSSISETRGLPRPPPPPPSTSFTFGSELHSKLVGAGPRNSISGATSNGNLDHDEPATESRVLRSRSVLEDISQEEARENGSLERVDDDSVDRCRDTSDHVTISGLRNAPPPKRPILKGGRGVTDEAKKIITANDKTTADVNGNAPGKNNMKKEEENIYVQPRDDFPSVDEPVPPTWRVEEGRFVIIYSALVSHLGTKLFFAPEAQLNDGVCWLMIIKGEASRRQIASYFINQEVGKHINLPWVRLFPVKAFRLESFDESIMTIDGEMVDTNSVQARVLPGKARVLSF